MKIEPYLCFNGRTDEAIEFYKSAVDAKVQFLMRFKDAPPDAQCNISPETLKQVMHATLTIGDSTLLVTDGGGRGDNHFAGISLTLNLSSNAEAEKRFAALAVGGKITMPITETFFAKAFGMVTDRFGVKWMVIHEKPM
jgi:PhnB protein